MTRRAALPPRRVRPPSRWRRFRRSERGSISAEAVVILPMLVWALFAGYVYFDAARTRSLTVKAANVVADVLSREEAVDSAYLDRMQDLTWMLTGGRQRTSLRVTVVTYESLTDLYRVSWSQTRGTFYEAPLGDGGVAAIRDRLPVMSDFDRLIVVETQLPYSPVFDVGLPHMDLETFQVTRPRFTPGLCWADTSAC